MGMSEKKAMDMTKQLALMGQSAGISAGKMTKDLALMVGPEQKWVNTTQLFDIIKNKLDN